MVPVLFFASALAAPQPLTFQDIRVDDASSSPAFRVQALDVLRSHLDGVVGGENPVVDQDDTELAVHVVAGQLVDGNCKKVRSWRGCTVTVEAVLADARTQDVLYRTTVVGQGEGLHPVEALENAVLHGLETLAQRPAFQAARESDLLATPFPVQQCSAPLTELGPGLEHGKQAVLQLQTPGGLGTAFVVSDQGYAITAAHVVHGHEEVQAHTYDGRSFTAEVVRVNHTSDVALLSLPVELPCAAFALEDPTAGAATYGIGHPGKELSWSVTRGVVSGQRDFGRTRVVQTDASINPGYSGGPLFRDDGRVAGIISFKKTGEAVEGLSFAVTPSSAIEALNLHWTPTPFSPPAAEPLDVVLDEVEHDAQLPEAPSRGRDFTDRAALQVAAARPPVATDRIWTGRRPEGKHSFETSMRVRIEAGSETTSARLDTEWLSDVKPDGRVRTRLVDHEWSGDDVSKAQITAWHALLEPDVYGHVDRLDGARLVTRLGAVYKHMSRDEWLELAAVVRDAPTPQLMAARKALGSAHGLDSLRLAPGSSAHTDTFLATPTLRLSDVEIQRLPDVACGESTCRSVRIQGALDGGGSVQLRYLVDDQGAVQRAQRQISLPEAIIEGVPTTVTTIETLRTPTDTDASMARR